jgi:hypothetical protein
MRNYFTRLLLCFLVVTFCVPSFVFADEPTEDAVIESAPEEGHSFVVGTLLYIPNRIFDLLDIVRFRVRVGPGLGVGARATSVVSAFVGSYATIFAGLPGPRLEPSIPLPVGLESHNGATVSLVDATVDGGIGPDYSSTEFGVSAQLAIVGFDFGIDPLEIVDFLGGILTIDLREDDL